MVKERIPLSEETKRKLLVESGHKCSIIGCEVKEDLIFHHINFNPSDNREENIIVLCPNHAAQADKKKITRKACEEYKRKLMQGLVGKEPESIKKIVEREGIDLVPESTWRKFAIIFGRKYLMWRYNRYDITLGKEQGFLIIIGIIFLSPILYEIFRMSSGIMINLSELYISFFLIFPAMAAFGIVGTIRITKCNKCSKNFGIRVIESKLVDQKEIYRTEEKIKMQNTERNTYECEFCGDKDIKNEVKYETIPIHN